MVKYDLKWLNYLWHSTIQTSSHIIVFVTAFIVIISYFMQHILKVSCSKWWYSCRVGLNKMTPVGLQGVALLGGLDLLKYMWPCWRKCITGHGLQGLRCSSYGQYGSHFLLHVDLDVDSQLCLQNHVDFMASCFPSWW